MKPFAWMALLIAGAVVACSGSGDGGGDKPSCGGPGSCTAGNYCAMTPDGNVCWPDAVKPSVTNVVLSCSDNPCLRTSTLRVSATVTDDKSMAGAAGVSAVVADGDGHQLASVALVKGDADTWAADVSLTSGEFPHFEAEFTATVKGVDEAGNEVTTDPTQAVAVTRFKWKKSLAGATTPVLSSPAVLKDGTAVLSGNDGKLYFVKKDGTSQQPVTVSPSPLSGPPAVAETAIWVGSLDGSLYWTDLAGKAGSSCVAGEPIAGAPAIWSDAGTYKAVVATSGSFVVVADRSGVCVPTVVTAPSHPVIAGDRAVFVPSGGKLGKYAVRSNGALQAQWTGAPPPPDIGIVTEAPAIGPQGVAWTTGVTGAILRTTPEGVAEQLKLEPQVSVNSTGMIVLRDGTAVLGNHSTPPVVRRISAGPGTSWSSPPLTGAPASPLALAGSSPSILVATTSGLIYLLNQSDGTILWSRRLTASNQPLETPNIWTEPGAATSTAYLAGADGTLYAIIVDGALDTSAPWPKAYHDPQNTSNAGYVP